MGLCLSSIHAVMRSSVHESSPCAYSMLLRKSTENMMAKRNIPNFVFSYGSCFGTDEVITKAIQDAQSVIGDKNCGAYILFIVFHVGLIAGPLCNK